MARGNVVVITGNLTGDPKFHTFPSGAEKATIQIAWNENRKNANDEWEKIGHFFEVECWQTDVTHIRKFSKGDLVTVYGRVCWRTWNEQDGSKREKVYITAESVWGDHMYDKPAEGTAPAGEPRQTASQPPAEPPAQTGRSRSRSQQGPPAAPSEPQPDAPAGDDDGIPW